MASPLKKFKELSITREEAIEQIKWMLRQAKPFRFQIFIMLSISIVSLIMSFAGTVIGKRVVDATTSGYLNIKYVIYMVAATLFSIAFNAVTRVFSDYVNEKFSFGMKCSMFDRVQRCVWQNLSGFHSGDVVTRLTTDVDTVSSGIISIIPSIIVTAMQLIIAFGILFYYDRPLALFAVILGPVGTIGIIFFRKKYSAFQTQLKETGSRYRSFMQENIGNIAVVKTFQREDSNSEVMEEIRQERMGVIMKSSRLSAAMASFMRIVYSTGYVAAFCWSAYRISKGMITYGTMTVFLTLVSQVQGSISALGQTIPQLYGMVISAKRINEVIDIEKEEYDHSKKVPEKISVKIKDLTFAYKDKNILQDMNIEVPAGQIIGVVGTSGIGKTTFIRLLLSLVKPQQGCIEYIDENGNVEIAQPDSRRFISYVPQGNTLFSGTIESNLRTGNPNVTEDDMWKALKMADADRFVRELPDGLNSVLGEKAGGISEGQAQRIAIARAILRDTPLLILDEATSALDEFTESRILSEITKNCGKTCFVITHRRSMLKYCDRVLGIRNKTDINLT